MNDKASDVCQTHQNQKSHRSDQNRNNYNELTLFHITFIYALMKRRRRNVETIRMHKSHNHKYLSLLHLSICVKYLSVCNFFFRTISITLGYLALKICFVCILKCKSWCNIFLLFYLVIDAGCIKIVYGVFAYCEERFFLNVWER